MMSSRLTTAFVLAATSVVALVPGAAASQVDGSVEQLPFPDFAPNEFVDERFSSDLSAAIFTQDPEPLIGEPSANAGITTVVDLSTGELVLIQAERGPSDQIPAQLDADGSHLLLSANWEGVVADDADGGSSDLFVVKTDTDDVIAITAGLTAEQFDPVGMSDDAFTVVFASTDIAGVTTLHLWQNDVVTDIPTVGVVDTFEANALSADGATLLYSTRVGADITWHAHDIESGIERTIAGTLVFDVGISDDGSVVVGTEVDADPAADNAVIWRTDEAALTRVDVPGRDAMLSGDGSTLFGTASRVDLDDEGAETEVNSAWRLDLATGAVTTILESGQRVRGVAAVSDDAASMVLHAAPASVGQRPVTLDFLDDDIERFFLIDFSEGPAVVPGYSGSLDAQLVRLYDAFFDRAPDAGGLEFWRDQRAQGQGLFDVSAAFAQSPEFVETYGDLDDIAFIELVYRNVLDRQPDFAGGVFWLDELANGRDRGSLMALFSDSPEFVESTGTLPPENAIAGSVRRLYAGYFGRSGDDAGLAFWIDQAEQGMELETISEVFRTSDEFAALYDADAARAAGININDPETLALIGYGNTVGELGQNLDLLDDISDGGTTAAQAMVLVTNLPEVVAITSTTPAGD